MNVHTLIVDNHDSFVFNLVELVREHQLSSFEIYREDNIPFDALGRFSHILLSPGPGLPNELPNLHRLIAETAPTHSILGVCLGHQALIDFFGGQLQRKALPKHGHQDLLCRINPKSVLLNNVPENATIGRYHSWTASEKDFPDILNIEAYDTEGNIMAIAHKNLPIFGVQFHPESIMTNCGLQIMQNWLHHSHSK